MCECWLTNTQGPESGSDQSVEGFLEGKETRSQVMTHAEAPQRNWRGQGACPLLAGNLMEPALTPSSVYVGFFIPKGLTMPSYGG